MTAACMSECLECLLTYIRLGSVGSMHVIFGSVQLADV